MKYDERKLKDGTGHTQMMTREGIPKWALYAQSKDQLSKQGYKINSDEGGSFLNDRKKINMNILN